MSRSGHKFVLFGLMAVCVFAAVCLADNSDESSAEVITGTCGTDLSYTYDTDTTVLTIAGTGYRINSNPWSVYSSSITSVVFNTPNLTRIDEGMFENCAALTNASLPDTVFFLGNAVFRGCTSLTMAKLPDDLAGLGRYAFANCISLALTSLPVGLTTIGQGAFQGCTHLALTKLSDGLSVIQPDTFKDCTALALTELPDSVTDIGDSAFLACVNISIKAFPENLTYIGCNSFEACWSITEIHIPGKVGRIRDNAFIGCTNLKTVYNDSNLDIGFNTDNGAVGNYADKIYEKSLAVQKIEVDEEKEGSGYSLLQVIPVFMILGVLMVIVAYIRTSRGNAGGFDDSDIIDID